MSIIRVQEPSNPPTSISDWTKAIAELRALALGIEGPLRIVGTNVVKGAVFQIGGTMYLADADTGISGTASAYVKIMPSGDGSTCSAAFVASLTSVAWNSTYNGWYDSGSPASLYVFDEAYAYNAGAIASIMDVRNIAPGHGIGKVPIAKDANWANALAAVLGANWTASLSKTLGAGWGSILSVGADVGFLAELLINAPSAGSYVKQSVPVYNDVWVIPAGLYMMTPDGVSNLSLRINTGSAWTSVSLNFGGGLVLSDGSNYALSAGGNNQYVHYRKLL
jgi:hypothetical protein